MSFPHIMVLFAPKVTVMAKRSTPPLTNRFPEDLFLLSASFRTCSTSSPLSASPPPPAALVCGSVGLVWAIAWRLQGPLVTAFPTSPILEPRRLFPFHPELFYSFLSVACLPFPLLPPLW